jgi:DHA2 family methylenomycin A resistance protein-like MFS transporter
MLSGRLIGRFGVRLPILLGLASAVLGLIGLMRIGAATPYLAIGLPLLGIGCAGGLIVPAAATALIGAVDKAQSGIASGVLNTARQVGSAIGVALFGALIAGAGNFLLGLKAALLISGAILVATAGLSWRFLDRRSG